MIEKNGKFEKYLFEVSKKEGIIYFNVEVPEIYLQFLFNLRLDRFIELC